MENVKGLLSAKVKGESTFDRILSDLRNPSAAADLVHEKKPKAFGGYKLVSLVVSPSN